MIHDCLIRYHLKKKVAVSDLATEKTKPCVPNIGVDAKKRHKEEADKYWHFVPKVPLCFVRQLVLFAFQMILDQASWLNFAPGLFRTVA